MNVDGFSQDDIVYEVNTYDPNKPLSVSALQEEWKEKRAIARTDLVNNHLTQFQATVLPWTPYAMFATAMLLLVAMFPPMYFFIFPLLVISIIGFRVSRKFNKVGSMLKSKADATVFLSVENWIKERYNMDVDYKETLSQVLSQASDDEEGQDPYVGLHMSFPNDKYRLDISDVDSYGDQKLIIRNVHGEAPLAK